jgi:hypothetical protein
MCLLRSWVTVLLLMSSDGSTEKTSMVMSVMMGKVGMSGKGSVYFVKMICFVLYS